MGRFRGSLLAVLLAMVPAVSIARDVDAPTLPGKWTITDPPINFVHIELGEINRHHEAVGYHYRLNGVDPPGARVLRIIQAPDANGVYRARVTLRDPATGVWHLKKAPSTFYPDAMAPDDVIDEILAVFRTAKIRNDGQFIGQSSHGFAIEGWYQNGRINAAYPVRGP